MKLHQIKKSISFNGVLKENEATYDFVDKVSNTDVDNDNIIEINCGFDFDSMKYNLDISIYNKKYLLLDVYSVETDAIINSNGRLDGYVILNEETSFYISDFSNYEALDNCFITLITTLVALGVAYNKVTESAEQQVADYNYEYNRKLEANNNGVGSGIYVTDQSQTDYYNRNAGIYKFGFTTFAEVGCEVAAAYNLLIAIGKSERLSSTIYAFEKLAIEFSIAFGKLGSNPLEIYRFLKIKNIKYDKYTNFNKFEKKVVNQRVSYTIMSRWNSPKSTGLHTFFVKKDRSDNYHGYNWKYDDTSYISNRNLTDFKNDGSGFIVGYVICV